MVTYLLSIIWVLLFAILSLPVVGWLVMYSVCTHELVPLNYTYNFSLTYYGTLRACDYVICTVLAK
jgi:hypothetical protein